MKVNPLISYTQLPNKPLQTTTKAPNPLEDLKDITTFAPYVSPYTISSDKGPSPVIPLEVGPSISTRYLDPAVIQPQNVKYFPSNLMARRSKLSQPTESQQVENKALGSIDSIASHEFTPVIEQQVQVTSIPGTRATSIRQKQLIDQQPKETRDVPVVVEIRKHVPSPAVKTRSASVEKVPTISVIYIDIVYHMSLLLLLLLLLLVVAAAAADVVVIVVVVVVILSAVFVFFIFIFLYITLKFVSHLNCFS